MKTTVNDGGNNIRRRSKALSEVSKLGTKEMNVWLTVFFFFFSSANSFLTIVSAACSQFDSCMCWRNAVRRGSRNTAGKRETSS